MIPVDHTIPLLMIPDNRTECGDPDQSQYGVGDLYPVSLAPFISPVGVTEPYTESSALVMIPADRSECGDPEQCRQC